MFDRARGQALPEQRQQQVATDIAAVTDDYVLNEVSGGKNTATGQ